jgi:hypothetical protein
MCTGLRREDSSTRSVAMKTEDADFPRHRVVSLPLW